MGCQFYQKYFVISLYITIINSPNNRSLMVLVPDNLKKAKENQYQFNKDFNSNKLIGQNQGYTFAYQVIQIFQIINLFFFMHLFQNFHKYKQTNEHFYSDTLINQDLFNFLQLIYIIKFKIILIIKQQLKRAISKNF
ncbi:hypothetical protein ABPG74_003952 [Tetrahymena malaccensis]